jgi:ribokinase
MHPDSLPRSPARITVMGSFVADVAFRTAKLPAWGETYMGSAFKLGPGGKGSNQAVAAARAGAQVSFIGKVGNDLFGELARTTFRTEGIDASLLLMGESATGCAAIIIDEQSGENAIVVVPGACLDLTPQEVDRARDRIAGSAIFVAQLELALPTVEHGLALAHSLGVPTILNPAPACKLPDSVFPNCDYLTPNESETEVLTGIQVRSVADAERAADAFLGLGVGGVVITMGAQGAFVKNRSVKAMVPAFDAGPVVETTGAGDAFNGGFAVALAEGRDLVEAARFGCATAGISVTRHGTAPSMPHREEIDALLASQNQTASI